MKFRWFLLIGLLLAILACQTIMPQVPQATPPGSQAQPLPIQTEAPAPEAASPGMPTARGFAAVVGHTIEFREKAGQKYAEIQGPESAFWEANRLHIAGPMPAGSQTVPLLYFVFDNGEALIYRDPNGQAFTLSQGEAFMGLTGVPARPLIAFSQLEYLPTNLRSKIYAGTAQTISSAAPLLTIDDPESWAIKVILLEAIQDVPTRVWYTRIAYGIGGDIVFEPRKSLWYLDVASGQTFQVLENEAAPWDISPDHSQVAYSNTGSGQPGGMALRNLQSGASVTYALRPASEPRGAGNAFFSPDGRYLAWMEGDGWMMADVPSFHATVRVGDLNGNVLAEFSDTDIGNALPGRKAAWVQPVGWLDAQTLLVQTRGQNWEEAAIVKIDLPSRGISYLAPGTFVGLVYP